LKLARLADLVLDYSGNRLSHSKTITWSTWLVSSVVVLRACWNAAPGDGIAAVLLAYAGLFVAGSVGNRYISTRVPASRKKVTP
jgi:hypothetical protein